MAKSNKFNWDSVLEVKDGTILVRDSVKHAIIVWNCDDEDIARFVWLCVQDLNAEVKDLEVSKIYKVSGGWSFAVHSKNPISLERTICMLSGCEGLSYTDEYPSVTVYNPKRAFVARFIPADASLNKVDDLTIVLSKDIGYSVILCNKYDPCFTHAYKICSIDDYFAGFPKNHFTAALNDLPRLVSEDIAPELVDYMMA